ncbi:hypothetical protein E2C01_026353 [Portunus trituberculatus]|uniref:Uncharacterized protein n=1 Tax=Portunus trituberculatus TaxID=210409 RepID=A0A5B7EHX9_PORTR|nr:hypothetical protein [Portunus trituberculatus]
MVHCFKDASEAPAFPLLPKSGRPCKTPLKTHALLSWQDILGRPLRAELLNQFTEVVCGSLPDGVHCGGNGSVYVY